MDEYHWLQSDDPRLLLELITQRIFHRLGAAQPSDRKVRLWSLACWASCSQYRHHPESVAAAYTDFEAGRDANVPAGAMKRNINDVAEFSIRCSPWGNDSIAEQQQWSLKAALLREIVGNPFRPLTFDRPCPYCLGNGYIHVPPPENVMVMIEQYETCRFCAGQGTHRMPPPWLTPDALNMAQTVYDGCDFAAMPILADVLEEAGCQHQHLLRHLRGFEMRPDWCPDRGGTGSTEDGWRPLPCPHVRGCWVLDLILGKG
jgi:hypothetical protein